jgi:hypothetical protein
MVEAVTFKIGNGIVEKRKNGKSGKFRFATGTGNALVFTRRDEKE